MLADRLRDAKHSIERSIKKDIEGQACEELGVPDFRVEIPVALKIPKADDCTVKKMSFHLLSDGAATDTAIWEKAQRIAENELTDSIKSASRTLDQTADKMRSNCTFSDDEVLPLSKYQSEDLKSETDGIYQQIVHIQGNLPKENVSANAELQETAYRVKRNLLGRVLQASGNLDCHSGSAALIGKRDPSVVRLPDRPERFAEYAIVCNMRQHSRSNSGRIVYAAVSESRIKYPDYEI